MSASEVLANLPSEFMKLSDTPTKIFVTGLQDYLNHQT